MAGVAPKINAVPMVASTAIKVMVIGSINPEVNSLSWAMCWANFQGSLILAIAVSKNTLPTNTIPKLANVADIIVKSWLSVNHRGWASYRLSPNQLETQGNLYTLGKGHLTIM